MRLRISACGGVFAVDGQVVWDDYLDQRQFVLDTDSDQVLRWFIRWRDRDSVPERHRPAVEALLANDILVAEGSQRDAQEQAVLHAWGRWTPVARAYHYSTRTTRGSRFPAAVDRPEPVGAFPATERIPLPVAEEARWLHRDLLDVLRGPRPDSRGGPVPLASLGALLQLSAGRSTELYPVIRDVEGLKPGVYHYDGRTHELALVGDLVGDVDLVAACGDQDWVTDAGLVVFYTSVVWRHESPRAYRVLQLDAGHVDQTLSLAATALGLRGSFTASIRDELVEELIGCDPATELAIGCAVVGT
jgi:SagB-type dehydrogenase family enzyme